MKKSIMRKVFAIMVAMIVSICSFTANAGTMVEIDYGSTTISPDCGGDVYVSYSVRYAGATHTASVTGWSPSLDYYSASLTRGFLPYNTYSGHDGVWARNNSTYFTITAAGRTVFVLFNNLSTAYPDPNYPGDHTHGRTVTY